MFNAGRPRDSRRRDTRLTFGNAHRRLALWPSLFEKTLVNRTLWRFHAAGVLPWVHVIERYPLATAHPISVKRRSHTASPSDTAMRLWSNVPTLL